MVGDRVVDLLSQRTSGLSASFCGPYTVLKKVGDKNYGISMPEGRQKTRLCHINLLKKPWAIVNSCLCSYGEMEMEKEDVSGDVDIVGFCLRNSEALRSLDDQLGHLPSEWKSDFKALMAKFSLYNCQ